MEDVQWATADAQADAVVQAEAVNALLKGERSGLQERTGPARALSIAGRVDEALGSSYQADIVADIAELCASLHDENVATCPSPLRARGLYDAFLTSVRCDLNMSARGTPELGRLAHELPSDALLATAQLLRSVDLSDTTLEDYLARLLSELQGWAGALRAQAFALDHNAPGALPELLSVRLAYDVALSRSAKLRVSGVRLAPITRRLVNQRSPHSVDSARLLLLQAAEGGLRRTITKAIQPTTRSALRSRVGRALATVVPSTRGCSRGYGTTARCGHWSPRADLRSLTTALRCQPFMTPPPMRCGCSTSRRSLRLIKTT